MERSSSPRTTGCRARQRAVCPSRLNRTARRSSSGVGLVALVPLVPLVGPDNDARLPVYLYADPPPSVFGGKSDRTRLGAPSTRLGPTPRGVRAQPGRRCLRLLRDAAGH